MQIVRSGIRARSLETFACVVDDDDRLGALFGPGACAGNGCGDRQPAPLRFAVNQFAQPVLQPC